jgi:hypothetical protein
VIHARQQAVAQTWPGYLIPSVEQILENHYNQRDNGAFQGKSSTAAVADKCSQAGYTGKECGHCKKGWTDNAEICRRCDGTGWKKHRATKVSSQTRGCPKCCGTGKLIPVGKSRREELLALLSHGPGERAVKITGADDCQECEGNGYLYQIEVVPKPAQMFGTPIDPSAEARDGNLELTVCLQRLQQNDQTAESHLLWLYGNAGSKLLRTEFGERYGRELVLWKFTAYGMRLILQEQATNSAITGDRAILEATKRADDITVALADNAQAHAQALKMAALAKLWTADLQTGGHVSAQAERMIG